MSRQPVSEVTTDRTMLPTTATASTPPPPPAPPPGEPHAALFFALGYMRLPELLACWRVCRLLGEAVAVDPLLWRRVAVERPLSGRMTDQVLLKLTARAEGTLRSLRLFGCVHVSDAGLLRVVEHNPRVTEIYVPACTGLTGDGVVKIVQLLHEHKGNISRLRLDGISGMSKHHLDIIMSLMCKGNPQGQQDRSPLFYNHRAREALNTNDERPIDVDLCPVCATVGPVFDCTRDDCRKVRDSLWRCRGCYFCFPKCEKCGGCVSSEDIVDADLACSDLMCLDCWFTVPKCSTCNRPYCGRHENLMVSLSMAGQFSCQRCKEPDASHENQEDDY
ncbi:hypothetical protein CFC21_031471 [Triticum aestivum]|nr:F-box protein SKIP28-like [Triticum aestivum]KAF7018157.1 hypothetical protein CFC21_031471 [Triticum aestivum]